LDFRPWKRNLFMNGVKKRGLLRKLGKKGLLCHAGKGARSSGRGKKKKSFRLSYQRGKWAPGNHPSISINKKGEKASLWPVTGQKEKGGELFLLKEKGGKACQYPRGFMGSCPCHEQGKGRTKSKDTDLASQKRRGGSFQLNDGEGEGISQFMASGENES